MSTAPEALSAVYTRLVARDADGRPATAHDVAVELRKLVPQGREEAGRALRRLLEAHFGEQAEEQRRRLTRSLEEVAPEQARELRESVSPDPATPPSTRSIPRPRASTASIADATGENPVSDGEGAGAAPRAGVAGVAGVAATTRELRPWPWLFAAALVLGGVGVWRATSGDAAAPRSAPLVEPSAAVPATTEIPGTATPAKMEIPGTATATAIATAVASASASAPATARAPGSALGGRATASIPAVTPRASATVSAKPAVSPPSTGSPSTPKPPPDVDDHPF
ncbi:MAG: serine/threonine protein kinase [Myxococcaceae bacterium]|nr:serine/threonine protein kinase [Myxococcaceae bacterium]